MSDRYPQSSITNLSTEETSRSRFVRTARPSHAGPGNTLGVRHPADHAQNCGEGA
jgi:hypothetical protein